MNRTRTFFLMLSLTILFVVIGGAVGGSQGAFIAFLFAAAINFFSYWFSDKMVLKQYAASEVGPDDQSRLYGIVSDLTRRAGLPMPRVFVVPEQNPNAFATGRNPEHASVAATEGILKILDDDELSGVMGHELAHVKHRDMLTGTIAATFAGAIAMLGQFARFGVGDQSRRNNPLGLILIMVGAPLGAMLIRMAVSRVREYAADEGGSEISGKPLALASALEKLQQGVQAAPLKRGNPAHSHMFIMNPFFGGLQKLFSTHPPVEERVKRLQLFARKSVGLQGTV
ncbi:MAG: zinc metalloprotease HtpX [Calditrichaeota bacterium]|nr:zinc metalloprotease HtpX [Calditrichota bacterium]RQW03718.1 MAG: zinc metalloprotease HtpX [Calditrichota bacterium]